MDNGTQKAAATESLNQKPGVQWLKGHLRDENGASKCVHLNIGNSALFQPQPAGNVADAKGQMPMRWVYQPAQSELYLNCQCESLLAQLRELKAFPPELDVQVTSVRVTLELCRMCNFWERAQ